MKYFLIANNRNINSSHLNQMEFDKNDVFILFNKMLHLKHPVILSHEKKYCVSRRTSDERNFYSGIEKIAQNQDLFERIYFEGCPKEELKEKICLFGINKEKIYCMDYTKNFKKMSSGFICYNWLLQIKEKEDELVLVGFTTCLNKIHDRHIENEFNFFKKELNNKKYKLIGPNAYNGCFKKCLL